MDTAFKALGDPTRRALLDQLFAQDGQTLVALATPHDMTRIAVAKHLRLLEEAGLVVSRRRGREKLHFLNPVPIRLIHDRWVSKLGERRDGGAVERVPAAGGLAGRADRAGEVVGEGGAEGGFEAGGDADAVEHLALGAGVGGQQLFQPGGLGGERAGAALGLGEAGPGGGVGGAGGGGGLLGGGQRGLGGGGAGGGVGG